MPPSSGCSNSENRSVVQVTFAIDDPRVRSSGRLCMGVGNLNRFTAGLVIAVAMVCSLIFGVAAHAQVTGATLSGTVTDPSGGVIAGAEVTATNTATGVARDTTSDSAGLYTIPNLLPGNYEVKVTATGFSTAVQSNLSLAVGQEQQLNFGMKVGNASTTVQVTESAPKMDLISSALAVRGAREIV